eukprot:7542223-Lingulodinium_polyedra.AAC.1
MHKRRPPTRCAMWPRNYVLSTCANADTQTNVPLTTAITIRPQLHEQTAIAHQRNNWPTRKPNADRNLPRRPRLV